MTLKQINFQEGYVLVGSADKQNSKDGAKLLFYPKEKLDPLWEEVKGWLEKQNLKHTILIGRLRKIKNQTPYCLVWERNTWI